jgi:hypothetical protein
MTAARFFYSFDFGTKFWDFLLEWAQNSTVASIDKVFDEINKGYDDLKKWANEKFREYFLNTKNEQVFIQYKKLMRWADKQNNHYMRNAIDDFMKEDNADPWLIAFALIDKSNYTIVTFEKPNPTRKNKIQIPNVCQKFGVECCDLYDMLKNLNFRL